jgi:threonine/homoserine/homoserine lactone efflux protein
MHRGGRFRFSKPWAFQWVNPKGWAMAVGAASTYAAFAAFPFNMLAIALVFGACGVVSSLVLVMFGTTLRRVVTDARTMRIFNIVMAVLLVASLIPVLGDL